MFWEFISGFGVFRRMLSLVFDLLCLLFWAFRDIRALCGLVGCFEAVFKTTLGV